MSIVCRLIGLFALLGISAGTAAAKANRVLKLPGNTTELVRWSPVPPHYRYQDLLPHAERMSLFQNLGYGSVTLAEKHEFVLRDDKLDEETTHSIQLYVTSSGISNGGNSGFWVDGTTQRAEILEAYVLQPDGTTIEVDPATLQITSDNSPDIFNDSYYVTVPFPQIRPGSISVLVYKTVSDLKKSPLPWSRILFPARFTPIESFQVRVDWTDNRRRPAWKTDYPELACRETPLSLSCATKKAIPPVLTERDMPSPYDVLPVLVLAEPTSWAAISATMQTLADSALSKGKEIKELAERLIRDAARPEERLNRLFAFVSRDIRYVGIEHGHSGVVPKPTTTTLAHRFGDCKDKTMLFVDLARKVGLDAYPVLTSTNRRSLSKLLLPASSYFNHMIACVKLTPNYESCVDLTDPYLSAEFLPRAIHGAVKLTVGRGTEAPGSLASETFTWKMEMKADNRLTDDGTIVETLERSYDSHWAAGIRSGLESRSQVDREQWLLEDYRNIMGDKVSPSLRLAGLDHPSFPLVISSTTEFRNAFDPAQMTHIVEVDPWLRDLARSVKTTNSRYAYSFQGIDFQSQITYRLNSGARIDNLGPKVDYQSLWGSFHRYYRKERDRVTVYTELKMPRAEIPVNDIAEFNRFLELTGEETRIWFGVQRELAARQ